MRKTVDFVKYYVLFGWLILAVKDLVQMLYHYGLMWRYTAKELRLRQRVKHLYKVKKEAKTFSDWYAACKELDVLEGNEEWKKTLECEYYDYQLVERRLKLLQGLSSIGDFSALVLNLRAGLLRKLGNMGDPVLYKHSHVGTKLLIESYINETVKQLEALCDCENSSVFASPQKKFDFFYETRQAFGRSALLLSGGATLGLNHFGVVKALYEQKLLPRVISGSSVGSIVAALVGVLTDDEIPRVFKPGYLKYEEVFGRRSETGAWKRKLSRLLTKGYLMDIRLLEECIRSVVGDVTFKEAYDKTGRILNITTASTSKFELPIILNYLTAPHVLIWSAACASCALWGLYEPVELFAKDHQGNIRPYHPSGLKWSDGSVDNDLPMSRLAELFNVNFFIVSQVNPHVVPFLRGDQRTGIMDKILFLTRSEIIHRVHQIAELGLLPPFFVKLQPLITQKYEGDITIIPPITLEAYLHILSNPSEVLRTKCTEQSERGVWPKISIIKNHFLIENTLEKCVLKLRAQLAADMKHHF